MNEIENALLVNGSDTSESKRAEDKIQQSEKLYRSLFENMLNGFAYCRMHVDDNGRPIDFTYLSVNNSFETLTGLKNVIGKKVTEVIPGIRESDPELFEIYDRVAKTGKPERFEIFVDALQMWFLISVYCPERGYFVAVFDVITERKKAEEELRTAHDNMQLLLDSIAEGAYGVDLNGNCTFVNKSFLRLLGYHDANELIGKQIHLLMHHSYPDGSNYPASECKMLNTRLTKEKINVSDEVFWRKDGVAIPVEYWSYPIIKEDKVIGSICTFIDITERKQAGEVIRESERLLNEAQHLAKLGNWYFNLVSGEVGWSKTLYEINKRDPKLSPPKYEELVSCYTKESWERLSRAVKKAIKDGTPYELELDIIRADGKIIQTHTYGKAVKDKSGRVIQLHGTVQDITERKLAEEAIKESEKKFRLPYNETPVMMHSINQERELLSVSDFWLEKFGYQREEVIGRSLTEFLTESSRKHAIETILPQFNLTGHIENADYCFVKKSGEVMDCLLSAISQYDNNKKFIRSLAVITDITERKLAEETVAKSEERYRDIVENISDLICTHDMEGRILSANPAAVKLLGYEIDTLLKINIQDILSPDTKDQFSHYIAALKKDGYSQGLMKVRTFAGNERIWEYNNTLRTHGVETPVVRGLAKDITERRQIEEKLYKLNESLEQKVIERTAQLQKSNKETSDYKFSLDKTSIVGITDQKGIIRYVNDNFCAISKYSREELLGQDHRIVNSGHHPKEFMRDLWTTIASGKIWRGDIKNIAKDGTFYWVDTSIVPFLNEQGKPYQYLSIRTDISERKKAEEQIKKMNAELEEKVVERTAKLVQSESQIRNFARHLNHVIEEEKANIAREIHDELGQLLAGIKMGLSSLRAPTLKGENTNAGKLDDMMKDIDNSIQVMRKISTQLRPGILDTLGLIPSIKWLAEEFEKKAKIKCHLQLNVNEEKFEKNISTCFFRICQESLTNIFKHANASEVVINVGHDKDSLMLKVSDNGKGIASEKLENPFSMGLLGMRERANIIGADLKITSKKDFGTTILLKSVIS